MFNNVNITVTNSHEWIDEGEFYDAPYKVRYIKYFSVVTIKFEEHVKLYKYILKRLKHQGVWCNLL